MLVLKVRRNIACLALVRMKLNNFNYFDLVTETEKGWCRFSRNKDKIKKGTCGNNAECYNSIVELEIEEHLVKRFLFEYIKIL